MSGGAIGERVSVYRRRRGISQAALAGLVGRSESWLSQVERGIRSVDSLPVILDLARVLRVEPEKLIGRPWEYAPNGDAAVAGLNDVRGFLTRYDDLLGTPAALPSDANALRVAIAEVHQAYQAARYQEVMGRLPGMLAAADRSIRGLAPQNEAARLELELGYVSAYVVAAKLLTKVGAADLALL